MVHYPRNGDDIDRGLIGYWKLDDLKRVPTDGIVAHYKMNDDAADRVVIDSKGGNDGTSTDNTADLTDTGKINECFTFDSTNNESVNLNKNLLDYPENFSVCFWIKRTGNQDTYARYFSGGYGGSSGVYGFSFLGGEAIDSTSVSFTIRTTDNDSKFVSHNLGDANWHHVVGIKDGTSIKLYVDNDLKDSGTLTQSEFARDSPTYFGGTGSLSNMNGSMDDVRIYDRALSESEIATIYNSDSGTETTELFRDTIVAIDRINFNDGQIHGCTNADGKNWNPSNSMSFDGVDDFIQKSSGFNLQPPFSINVWFNATTISNLDYIFYRQDDEPGLRFNTLGKLACILDNAGGHTIDSISAVSTGVWHMATITYDGTNGILYLNGIFQSTDTHTPFSSTSNTYRFGGDGSVGRFLNGTISKIRAYNRVLTQGEVSKLYRLKK